MKFDEFDKRMRVYETTNDRCVLPGVTMVARLDGRGFTKLTRESLELEAPYDEMFRDAMVDTVKHLMDCGFAVEFGYTQSDEISLLIRRGCESFGRKSRKLNSILAGEASAFLSLQFGQVAVFDCRISELPSTDLVTDYFEWRSADALRNSLNSHCYWMLRKNGFEAGEATKRLSGKSVSEKNELLFSFGLNFNEVPAWQKRGVGVVWETYRKKGVNPKSGERLETDRRRMKPVYDLPTGDDFRIFIGRLQS